MGSLFTELFYGFSVYRVCVWVFSLQSCCMGSRFKELLYGENPYTNSVNREPIQQLCKPRTHTRTGSRFTELLYGFSVYRVCVWVLGLQSCCMGSLFTDFLYGFSVYSYNNSVNREPIQQLCKPRTRTTTL
jgi:hypothetical protein